MGLVHDVYVPVMLIDDMHRTMTVGWMPGLLYSTGTSTSTMLLCGLIIAISKTLPSKANFGNIHSFISPSESLNLLNMFLLTSDFLLSYSLRQPSIKEK